MNKNGFQCKAMVKSRLSKSKHFCKVLLAMVGRIKTSQRWPCPNPRTCVYVILHGKGEITVN